MDFAVHLPGAPNTLLAKLCPLDGGGHILFGCAGQSQMPGDHSRQFSGSVEIIDYLNNGRHLIEKRLPQIQTIPRHTHTLR
jgi:hypothetical protein